MVFLLIVVSFDRDFAIWFVENLSFGRPGASTLAPWGPFWLLEDTLGDHRSSRKDMSGSRITFSVILGRFRDFFLGAFWVQMVQIQFFCSGLFLGRFVYRIVIRTPDIQKSENQVFVAKVVQKTFLRKKVFWCSEGWFVCVFRRPWNVFFWFLLPWRQA